MSHTISKNSSYIIRSNWRPSKEFRATSDEIQYVQNLDKSIIWCKDTFHTYFKNIEKILLENFRDIINKCHKCGIEISHKLIDQITPQWHMLALIRDFHDHMCGRDRTHYIRTDDCRRFLSCVLKGLKIQEFSKPVHRLLCGENAPRRFVHPRFIKFNYTNSY
jgi:hypothetical protein